VLPSHLPHWQIVLQSCIILLMLVKFMFACSSHQIAVNVTNTSITFAANHQNTHKGYEQVMQCKSNNGVLMGSPPPDPRSAWDADQGCWADA